MRGRLRSAPTQLCLSKATPDLSRRPPAAPSSTSWEVRHPAPSGRLSRLVSPCSTARLRWIGLRERILRPVQPYPSLQHSHGLARSRRSSRHPPPAAAVSYTHLR